MFTYRFDETKQARLRCKDVAEHDKIAGYLAKNFGRHDITLVSGDKTLGEMTFGRVDRKPSQVLETIYNSTE